MKGLFVDTAVEATQIRQALDRNNVPFRTLLTPISTAFRDRSPAEALAACGFAGS